MLRCCSLLSSNQLSGAIPASLGRLTALQSLCVRRGQTTPSHHLYAAPRLTRVVLCCCSELAFNQLSGGIPASLGSLAALQSLCVRRGQTTPSHHLYAAPRLTRVVLCCCSGLAFNQLSGGIPASLGNLTALLELCVRRVHTSRRLPMLHLG